MGKFTSHETNNDACVRSRCNEPQRCPPRPSPPRKSDLEFDRRQLKAKRTRYGSRHPVCAHAYVPHKHTHTRTRTRAEDGKKKRYMQAHTHARARGGERGREIERAAAAARYLSSQAQRPRCVTLGNMRAVPSASPYEPTEALQHGAICTRVQLSRARHRAAGLGRTDSKPRDTVRRAKSAQGKKKAGGRRVR